jgi:Tfp pilus assembly protein PilZ
MDSEKKKEIVIIAPGRESMALYKIYLTKYTNFIFRPYFQIEDFTREMFNSRSYAGFIVDLRNLLKCDPDVRDSFMELIAPFPLIRISHSIDKKTVKGNIRDKNYEDAQLFDHFINSLCRRFPPRGLRFKKRKKLFLNVYLDFSSEGAGTELIKTNTADVSQIGGFIISVREANEDDILYMVINELSDHTPIKCKVKWNLPWGTSDNHLPGFGVAFWRIKPEQQEELAALLKRMT